MTLDAEFPGERDAVEVTRRDDVVTSSELADTEPDVAIAVLVLCATLAAATVGQGAFYGPTRWIVAVGLAMATLLSVRRMRTSTAVVGVLPWACAALGAWAIARGADGDLPAGLAQAALILGLAAVVWIGRRWTPTDHDTVYLALLIIGLGVALSGWLGVAVRSDRWALEGATTWRASATLTYPNSAAAVMVAVLLLAAARLRTIGPSPGLSAASCVLLAGVAATQSRGGAVALLVGLVVLMAIDGLRPLVRSMIGPIVGAGVAVALLFPGLDPDESAQPVVAILGLVAGVAISILVARHTATLAIGGVTGAIVAAAALVAVFATGRLGRLPTDRLSLTSADRESTTRAALDVMGDHLLFGVGPGDLRLVWRSDSTVLTTELVHNEYLQVAAELGLVGACLLLMIGVGVVVSLHRIRRHSSGVWSGGVAALAALSVHSAFDFLWHISAIPLIGATIFALCCGGGHSDSGAAEGSR